MSHQHQQKKFEEVPLGEAIKSLLGNERLSDLTLKSSVDGTEFKVHRLILAARSPVFEGMLYGEFVEASKSVVELSYPGDVLRNLVDYVYTGEAPGIAVPGSLDKTSNDTPEQGASSEEKTKIEEAALAKIVPLMDAAAYFALTGLTELAVSAASSMVEMKPHLSVPLLALCNNYPIIKDSGLEEKALDIIRKKPELLLGEQPSAGRLCSAQIERIASSERMNADEFTVFKILQAWSDANVGDASGDRNRKAEELLEKHVALEGIDPTELSTTVKSSGLVSDHQLLDAFEKQALAAEKQGILYKRSRLMNVWRHNDDALFVSSSDEATFTMDY